MSSQVTEGGKIAIDTSAIIALFRGSPQIASCLNSVSEVWLPVIVIGELYCGLRKCNHPSKESKRVQDFCNRCRVVAVDDQAAKIYASVHADLEVMGTRIPMNDMWIAACAIRHDLRLVAADNHFKRIERLNLVSV